MRVKSLLCTDRSVILRQFLQIPFFGSFTRYPFFHSVGPFSCSQIFKNVWCNIYCVFIGSAFRASGGMPSGAGVFPSFNIFSVLLFLAFEGRFVLTLNNISTVGISGLSAGVLCWGFLRSVLPTLIYARLPYLWFFLPCLLLVLKDFIFPR